MVVVAFSDLICPTPPRPDGRFGRERGHKAVAPNTDEVRSTSLEECLADHEVVLRFEELEQGPLKLAVFQVPGDINFLADEWSNKRRSYTYLDS
jgi:hypothetical protein